MPHVKLPRRTVVGRRGRYRQSCLFWVPSMDEHVLPYYLTARNRVPNLVESKAQQCSSFCVLLDLGSIENGGSFILSPERAMIRLPSGDLPIMVILFCVFCTLSKYVPYCLSSQKCIFFASVLISSNNNLHSFPGPAFVVP